MAGYNPYAPPSSTADIGVGEGGMDRDAEDVPEPIVDLLRQTRPWVLFLSILGFVGTGLMVLVGLGMLAMGRMGNLPGAVGLVYVVAGAVYLFPSLRLLHYASSIGRLLRDPRMERLRAAVEQQKSFWKLVGIIAAVVLALYPIAIVVGVVVAVAARPTP